MLPISRKEETNKYYQLGWPNKNQIENMWGLENPGIQDDHKYNNHPPRRKLYRYD